jgi:hypothetical protein
MVEIIGSFELHNRGGPYNSKISCKYGDSLTTINKRAGDSGTIMDGGQKTVKCIELGVPNQNYMRFHLNVVAGSDREADEIFQHDINSTHIARYECSGAVDTAKLTYIGISIP